ncbi:54S ribosomal subunit img1, mitochondrial [Lecanosticta acicola]|uniref:54S ribosomal subunit img1, mitochondrial n=1 Tax=Lecanosticta acicola TaxID=111012 RepID=A0AAI8YW10_9PEZI|nr:54S ribosomal subunit img1, mitochondrial [Lecanosticta acicola]
MSTSNTLRPLAGLKQAVRQCRAERKQCRHYATTTQEQWAATYPPEKWAATYPSLEPAQPSKYKAPSEGFRPSQAIKQNRVNENLRKIKTYPSPRSALQICPDPVKVVFESQLKTLDPTGARTRLFSPQNADRVKPGDILLVRFKNGDPFSGVCITIRQRNSPIDTAILLRNQLTRVGVEMWIKIYSPNVEGIEIAQRKQGRRARRAKLTYMRKPKHDIGSVENIVTQYMKQRLGTASSGSVKGRDANSHKKGGKGKKGGKK